MPLLACSAVAVLPLFLTSLLSLVSLQWWCPCCFSIHTDVVVSAVVRILLLYTSLPKTQKNSVLHFIVFLIFHFNCFLSFRFSSIASVSFRNRKRVAHLVLQHLHPRIWRALAEMLHSAGRRKAVHYTVHAFGSRMISQKCVGIL